MKYVSKIALAMLVYRLFILLEKRIFQYAVDNIYRDN